MVFLAAAVHGTRNELHSPGKISACAVLLREHYVRCITFKIPSRRAKTCVGACYIFNGRKTCSILYVAGHCTQRRQRSDSYCVICRGSPRMLYDSLLFMNLKCITWILLTLKMFLNFQITEKTLTMFVVSDFVMRRSCSYQTSKGKVSICSLKLD